MSNHETTSNNVRDQLILEYFKALRSEIDLRIRNHTTLVTAKIVTAGAIFAFMLREYSNLHRGVSISGFLLVPIVSMLYDILISNNVGNINRMGVFIRDKIEPRAGIPLWEKCVAQKSRWTRCYGIADIIALSIFTLGTILAVIPILCSIGEKTFVHYAWPFVVLFWLVVTSYMAFMILGFQKQGNSNIKCNSP